MNRVYWWMILISCIGCSKSNGNNPSNSPTDTADARDSQTAATTDSSTSDSASSTSDTTARSSDSAPADSGSGSDTQPTGPELLYNFPELEGEGGGMANMEVDGSYIYYSTLSGIFRAPKEGGGATEYVGGRPQGNRAQDMAFSNDYVFWLGRGRVNRMSKSTSEQTEFLFNDDNNSIDTLTADADRLYFAENGCRRILSMNHDGGDIIESTMEVPGDQCMLASLIVDSTHVYCGAGGCQPNTGKIFKCPKQGGEITEMVALPDLDTSAANFGPQASGLVVSRDKMYILSNFRSAVNMQYFGFATLSAGAYTRVAELSGTLQTDRLTYDKNRNALYFLAQGAPGIRGVYKYDLIASGLSYYAVQESVDMPMAADEDYVYWHNRSQIYRLKKF